ncbi:aminotransferase class IV [Riemerella columbina]|uniref:aminotransferase class IV n=1 Tax=Riemerella columbina TaxID=103810 RepID=UPI00267065BA|nr:aminotransferase class IV [Riemerella columbina]WKS95240.1 aminotransferase class IV [Riemerella columbina]
MCQFIESIQCRAGKILNLPLHQQRVDQSLERYKTAASIHLEAIISALDIPPKGIYKLRILYDTEGVFSTEFQVYQRPVITQFRLVEAPHIQYDLKYANREALLQLKSSQPSEEVIITQNGAITDTSFSNLVFLKDDKWYTPETFLLNGVQRQHLLNRQQIQSMAINTGNLPSFSHFKIINAMNELSQSPSYPISQIIL